MNAPRSPQTPLDERRHDGILGVVLAAGEGKRFGDAKQLAELDGRPLLEHALIASARAGLARRLLVLGARAERILDAIDLHGHEVVVCDGWQEGMAASLRSGVEAARSHGADAILVTLGDQPKVTADALLRVLGARGGPDGGSGAVRASYRGVPGHPALLESRLFDALLALRGDEGARGVFRSANTHLVPCEDIADLADVDQVSDLAAMSRPPLESDSHA